MMMMTRKALTMRMTMLRTIKMQDYRTYVISCCEEHGRSQRTCLFKVFVFMAHSNHHFR